MMNHSRLFLKIAQLLPFHSNLKITLVLKQELIDCEAGGTVAGSLMGASEGSEKGANSQCEETDEQYHASFNSKYSAKTRQQ